MMTAQEFFQSFKSALENASESPNPNEAMEKVIKDHYPPLSTKYQNNAVFVRKGDSLWLCTRVSGPKKFRVSENRNVGAASMLDVVDDCSVDQLVADIAKLAGR